MGQHGAPGLPDDGAGDRDVGPWRAATRPGGLSAALEDRATLKTHGPEGCRLVLHRSAVSRVLAVMALALILVLLSLLGMKALADPFDRDSRGAFWVVVIILAIPAALRAINLFRRRTVLSASGIELHRLVWTERRPWPATASGFDISARVISDEHGDQIERYRLALVDSTPAWRRIWEFLCDAGLFLTCLGVLLILAAAAFLIQARHNVVDVFYALLLLLVAHAALGYTAVTLIPYLRKTVVDREGIDAGGERLAWPQSRSSLYVLGDRVALESPDGRVTALPGTGGVYADFERRGAMAAAQCEEIWRWGVANGVVQRGTPGA